MSYELCEKTYSVAQYVCDVGTANRVAGYLDEAPGGLSAVLEAIAGPDAGESEIPVTLPCYGFRRQH